MPAGVTPPAGVEPAPNRRPAAPASPLPCSTPLRELLAGNWPWLVLMVVGLGVAGFAWGYLYGDYSASARLLVSRLPTVTATAQDRLAVESPDYFLVRLADDLRSREFLGELAQATRCGVSEGALRSQSELWSELDSGRFTIRLHGSSAETVVQMVNVYAAKALQRIRELWENELARERLALEEQMALVDLERNRIRESLRLFQTTNAIIDADREYVDALDKRAALETRIINLQAQLQADQAKTEVLLAELQKQNPVLQAARASLNQALLLYTEEHPKVKSLRAGLAQLEAEVAGGSWLTNTGVMLITNTLTVNLYLSYLEQESQVGAKAMELESLNDAREKVHGRLQELMQMNVTGPAWKAQCAVLAEQRSGLFKQRQTVLLLENQAAAGSRILELASIENVGTARKWTAGCLWGGGFGLLGGLCCVAWLAAYPGVERRIRSEADLAEISALPVLASLDDLRTMSELERDAWANETLTVLKAKLCGPQKGLMLAFTSSLPREGKTTWIKLLSGAACQQGYRVVVVSSDVAPSASSGDTLLLDYPGGLDLPAVVCPRTAIGAEPPSPVCIPLADWMWQWQHRQQFQQALANSFMIENLALFVELPAYSTPGGVSLAEEVPNLVWLCGSGLASRRKTQSQLETLRLSGGNLAAAVFNRSVRKWRMRAAAGLVLLASLAVQTGLAQEPKAGELTMSASAPGQLADWQRHLTFGPGDVLNLSLYGQPDSSRGGLTVGPDGRINYLQARDVMAAGLTVEELRAELEKVLAKFHLSPQVVINPVSYRSKKYYLMGNVVAKGIQPLDRPTSIIEAIAKAKGFITAPQYQNVALMVDLPRSFLVRRNMDGSFGRVAVDFEALFLRGDLKQNIALAPDDFLFFPPPGLQEVYVVGEVRGPGMVPFSKDLTTLGAVVARGGFTDKAWQTKVLVIRGSLSFPEPHVVNMADILKARGADFRLANRDIVYVHSKPWAKAEELVENGILTFAQAAVTAYTGNKIGPFIKESLIK